MIDLLVVSGVALWPVSDGGDGVAARVVGLVEALCGRFSVRLVAPVEEGLPTGLAVGVDPLPAEEPAGRLVALLSPQARQGRAELGPTRSRALLRAVADHRPRAVLFLGGALAAASPTIEVPVFVDFPSLSVRGTGLEAVKARWWEPVEARRAVAVSTPSANDAAVLPSWGARAVVVPDGSSAGPLLDAVEEVVRASPRP